MDQGGFLANTVGVGPNGIFEGGAGDDLDVDFGKDLFVANEGFTGTEEDTLNSIAFGLSTGTLDQGMVVISSSPAEAEFVSSPPSDFVVDFLDPYDPATVDASDFYSVTLADHEPLNVETFTPAASSGEFVNVLDPVIRLYDADDNLVASDDNSSTDGRNAKLSYRVPKDGAGSYFIEVASSEETSGEYILAIKHPKASMTPGDANGDFLINLGDVAPLIQSLVDWATYDLAYPGVFADTTGDVDGNGKFDLGDISAFGKLFGSGLISKHISSTRRQCIGVGSRRGSQFWAVCGESFVCRKCVSFKIGRVGD